MKIRHLENARLVVLASYIAARIFTMNDETMFSELNSFLLSNGITMEDITPYLSLAYNASILTGFKLEQLCEDYSKIDFMYNTIICNIASLIESFGIQDDPVKVFALYIYLYRGGYLSVNRKFEYSSNMKDLPVLNGVDVVLGSGVCRSISSMFTDICKAVGLTATNVSVRVKSGICKNSEDLSLVKLNKEKSSEKFVKIVGKMTSIIPVGNHLVTIIEHDKYSGVYDSTNDIFMNMIDSRKYEFINKTGATMSYNFVSNILPKLLGQMDCEIDLSYLNNISKMDKVDYTKYKMIYEEINKLILDNQNIFEEFYNENVLYYKELNRLASEQNGMLKRMFPFFPNKKRK